MKQIIFILIVLMISFTTAINITAGESVSIEMQEYQYYSVVGNSSDVIGMIVSWENGNTTISFDLSYKQDNFTILFFDIEENVIQQYSSGGGGTSYRDNYIYREVPTYIDREVEVEVPVNNTEYKPIVISDPLTYPLWLQGLVIIGIISLVFVIFYIVIKMKGGNNEDE